MFNRSTKPHIDRDKFEVVPNHHTEIARVLLIGDSEVLIYRDKPGQLLFGLFNSAPIKLED